MKSNTFLALCLLLVIITGVTAISGQGIAGANSERPHDREMPSNVTLSEPTGIQTDTQRSQTYTVIANDSTAVNTTQLQEFGDVITHSDLLVKIQMSPAAKQEVVALPWVKDVQQAAKPITIQDSEPSNVSSLGVDHLHQTGVTGNGTRVGVIDIGFDTTAPGIESNIVASCPLWLRSPAADT